MYNLFLAPNSPQVVMYTAHVDYVRLTHGREGEYEAAARLYQSTAYACLAQATEGEVWFTPWTWQGYYGARGGPTSYGTGVQGCILQVSGPGADSVLHYALPFDNVARLDIAYTVWLSEDRPSLPREVAEYSKDASAIAHGGKWGVEVRDTYGNGDTAYIGSRTSGKFARCYDKGRESRKDDTYRNAYRFELEYKNEAARALWPGPGRTPRGGEHWAGVVCAELRARGVPLRRPPGTAVMSPVRLERPQSDADTRLRWLRNQVAPAIEKLEAQGVSRATILDALGMGDFTVR